ncbi:MAG: hypothetical protein IKH16_03230, partial [Selenomonadaceae bacterium]|nr:hypothetical protein [Selenomonadaceae bacterium]
AGNIWLEARVTPEQKGKIRLGQFVTYEIEGHALQGTVLEIESDDAAEDGEASAQTDTEGNEPPAEDGKSTVKISLPAEVSFELKPGMKTVVQVAVDQ